MLELTAEDLMSRDLITISKHLSLQGAAHRLIQAHVSGAPVIDERGRCVGVLSATDLMRWLDEGHAPARHPLAREANFHHPWQIPEPEDLPDEEVGQHMTADVVTAPSHARIGELARKMIDAHIHRVFILDGQNRPAGVVTGTDILAAVADHDERERQRTGVGPEQKMDCCTKAQVS
jgi:CBS domain-containing protein